MPLYRPAAQARLRPVRRQDGLRRREPQVAGRVRRERGGRSRRLAEAGLIKPSGRSRVKVLGAGDVAHALTVARARRERVRAREDRGEGGSRRDARRAGAGFVIESLQSFQNVFKIPELKRRVIMTVVLLVAYRLGAHVPRRGSTDTRSRSSSIRSRGRSSDGRPLLGGNLRRLSIFALGIMPYISASIILQLLTVVIPTLERLAKEGEAGRRRSPSTPGTARSCCRPSRRSASPTASRACGARRASRSCRRPAGVPSADDGDADRRNRADHVDGRADLREGHRERISLIIFAGIVVRLPSAIQASYTLITTGELKLFVFGAIILVMVGVTAAVVLMQEASARSRCSTPSASSAGASTAASRRTSRCGSTPRASSRSSSRPR